MIGPVSAQDTRFVYLYQYFEQDSLARPGYASIRMQETITNIHRGRDVTTVLEWLYDESGRLIEEKQDGPNLTLHTTFYYDSLPGRPSRIVRTGGRIKQEAFARYDSLGRLAEVISCQDDAPCATRHYLFDEDNTRRVFVPRQSIGLQFDKGKKAGSIFGFSTVNRQQDELVEEKFFSPDGKLEETKTFVRDTFSIGFIFDYNSAGQNNKTWLYTAREKKPYNEFTYDKAGLPLSETIFAYPMDGRIIVYRTEQQVVIRLQYDEKKRLKRTERSSQVSSTGMVREYFYTEY